MTFYIIYYKYGHRIGVGVISIKQKLIKKWVLISGWCSVHIPRLSIRSHQCGILLALWKKSVWTKLISLLSVISIWIDWLYIYYVCVRVRKCLYANNNNNNNNKLHDWMNNSYYSVIAGIRPPAQSHAIPMRPQKQSRLFD